MKNDTNSNTSQETIGYALGFCEAKISEIARDSNEPEQELRQWVGILLLTQRTGIINRMSPLSGKASKLHKALGKMEMDEQPYRKTRRTHPSSKVNNPIKKGYSYKGKHWTQRPENAARVAKLAKERGAKLLGTKRKVA